MSVLCELVQALRKQSRTHQQHQRQRRLQHHQPALQQGRSRRRRPRPAAQSIRRIRTRRDPRRRHAKQNPRHHRQPKRKSNHRQRRAGMDRNDSAPRETPASAASAYPHKPPPAPPCRPAPASSKLSVSNCRMILPRIAPSAVRTDISVCRPMPRTSSRFAMFAHAISSTRPRIHISSRRCDAYSSCRCLNARPARRQHDMSLRQQLLVHAPMKTPCSAQRLPQQRAHLILQRPQRHARLHPPDDVEPIARSAREHTARSPAPAWTQSADNNPAACSTAGRRKIPAAQSPPPSPPSYSPRTCCQPPKRRPHTRAARSHNSSPRSSERP